MLSTTVLIAASMVWGQTEVSPHYEHLKAFDGLIGKWVYKGPVLEDVPNLPSKDTPMVVHSEWRWLYNKAVVENAYKLEFENAPSVEGKVMYGWNGVDKEIVNGGMGSNGAISLGRVTVSDDGKTFRNESEAVHSDGVKTTGTVVISIRDDGWVWQNIKRSGRDLPPDSPKYKFTPCTCKEDEDADD